MSPEVTLNAIGTLKEKDKKHKVFYDKVEKEIIEKKEKADPKAIAASLKDTKTPSSIERNKGNGKVKHASVKNFLEECFPKDRYHEGHATESIRDWSRKIKENKSITA